MPPLARHGRLQKHRYEIIAFRHTHEFGIAETCTLDGTQDVLDTDIDATTTNR
jgi:hypothetical protein